MILFHGRNVTRGGVVCIARRFYIRLAAALGILLALAARAPAQVTPAPALQPGKILGTVVDVNGGPVTGATVALTGTDPSDRRAPTANETGFFEFDGVKPRVPYVIVVSAGGFADWTSPAITLEPGQPDLLGTIQLRIATARTTVEVKYDPVEIATEEFKMQEKQRILGVIPNFYVAYDSNAEPLTKEMKFRLALKVSVDPVTIAGIALISGFKQAGDTPHYREGAEGYGERFGATAADGFTDIMIGGAILPSLLHQDPRYFYKGTGTTKSRLRHAMLSPFIAKGDNGKWQPNYSSLGGDLASGALANLYYPSSNRGAGLVFSNFAIGTAERVGAAVAQEFLLGKFTRRAGHIN